MVKTKIEKFEVGEIRPTYQIIGFQVCKVASDNPEETEWTPVEKINEAEVLSFIYQQGESTTPSTAMKTKKKVKKLKETDDEDEEDKVAEEEKEEITDEDL